MRLSVISFLIHLIQQRELIRDFPTLNFPFKSLNLTQSFTTIFYTGICSDQHLLSVSYAKLIPFLSVTLTTQNPFPQASFSFPACWAVSSARCSGEHSHHTLLSFGSQDSTALAPNFFGIQRNVFLTVVLVSAFNNVYMNAPLLQYATFSVTSCRPLQLVEVRCLLGSAI